jgi:hypothetical protein
MGEHIRLDPGYPYSAPFSPNFDVMLLDPVTHDFRYLYTIVLVAPLPVPSVVDGRLA